ncbi:MAG: DegT/DnrJ/EryC1/StrS family aminotransferase [Methylobacterium frigidaeris]
MVAATPLPSRGAPRGRRTGTLLVSEPTLGPEEAAALARVVEGGWITQGERVRAFERAFAEMHGAEDAVAVSSCTAALHLILHGLGIGPGDEVLVPALTFVASANCVLYVGATPVFVDVEAPDLPLMSLADAAARCTARTKAVILVHFAGYEPDREAWRAFARERGLRLVEDAAHAAGLPGAGTFGDAAAFSFYGNKNMTTAEGGMVLATDEGVRETIRRARAHGMTSGAHQRLATRAAAYDVIGLGFNYRLDELRAAIGLVQLARLPEWNRRRGALAALYRSGLRRACPEVTVPFEADRPSVHHIMPVLLPPGTDRQRVVDGLWARDIQTTLHYPPVHHLSFYAARCPGLHLPATEDFARRELTLPLHPAMRDDDVAEVVDALTDLVRAQPAAERPGPRVVEAGR